MDKLLTFNESAAFLGIKDEEFKIFIDEHKIPHYKIAGKFTRFSQQELKKYVDILKEYKSSNANEQDVKAVRELEKAREIEYKRENLSFAVKVLEFIKFNDFYILSFLIILTLLFYIIKF